MESISHHIMPLVINSLGGGHTHAHARLQTFADRSNFKKPGAPRPQKADPSAKPVNATVHG